MLTYRLAAQAHSQKLLLGDSFVQNADLFNKIVDFLNKTVDPFSYVNCEPLFERGSSAPTKPPWLWACNTLNLACCTYGFTLYPGSKDFQVGVS